MRNVIRSPEDLLSIDDLDRAIVNLAEWLHYRCDYSMNAAREKVRVTWPFFLRS